MKKAAFAVLGVGNILEMDDGIAVYATSFLQQNYTIEPEVEIINGGVEGINLLNVFMEHERILILDAVGIEDEPGSIYHIPSSELSGYGINSGGAHEVGVMQCIDMLELLAKPLPQSSVLGIVPHTVKVHIGLTPQLHKQFGAYMETIVRILEREDFVVVKNIKEIPLEMIIAEFKNPRRQQQEIK